ncbi:helix-turn-helix domain-containing protein [Qipengyuania atrilutea]|uniref:DUF4019 domain-containing protein n=1 Tax=Qipengyuania atrilutea TaxID=2744473 RepID=A0A850H404_9SPHN|nr:DUF4019 domain-containing protein [Actirhodobacter atriluteus]NVD44603.1 DUF4019 domain-containing protein [Actirhodobacter atriluteus]
MDDGYDSLSEKERETLRLLLHGHDAKSMAGTLGLSVHTVNERLRNARRKLHVTSSKEAARLLFERESDAPHFLGHKTLGDADEGEGAPDDKQSQDDGKARIPRAYILAGVLIMSLFFATLALGLLPGSADEPTASSQTQDAEVLAAARRFVELVDAGDWEASYERTAASFREANTLAIWSQVSEDVRPPLGKVLSRKVTSVEDLPTPQNYYAVKFATDFAEKAGATETVTLAREDGAWRVVGIFIE